MDCRVYAASGDPWLQTAMVSDFLENGSSCGADSRCSSDSDSGFCELANLADKISYDKVLLDQHGIDMLSVVNSLIVSINSKDLDFIRCGSCNASCIRFSLVKRLRLAGYDAAVCISKWQGSGKVPGGDHEYIDIINYSGSASGDRLIIDIDFRSHFEIARAVPSYNRILNSLPVVFVGSLSKLKQFLQVMVEAAKSSLKQNSMPLPPWRSLAYLQSKWHSPYQRLVRPDLQTISGSLSFEHKRCVGHLNRLKSLIQFEMETERTHLKKVTSRVKVDRWRLRTP
ncbi:PDDEXK-like protein [Artemisia annua]|uniref:PDDEXK-like protein n=1 Tax=Artemisia annua TaxID=35608 RepID=A0A2U1QA86_ARTAN|nr:PDDEXK-like protein [Artemisia annua]PWA94911.1 PDDEXK-like protein [Artemisia annua]